MNVQFYLEIKLVMSTFQRKTASLVLRSLNLIQGQKSQKMSDFDLCEINFIKYFRNEWHEKAHLTLDQSWSLWPNIFII